MERDLRETPGYGAVEALFRAAMEPGGDHHARSPVMASARLRTPTLLTAGPKDRVGSFPATIDLMTRVVAWLERHLAP